MKYMGSKSRVAKEIIPIILKGRKSNQCYVEPFVGGSNVIDKVSGKRIGGDNNKYLIALYHKLQQGYIPQKFISREEYYQIKLNMDTYPQEVVALCGILASFNGNWFRAYGGYSKTASGKDRNYYEEGVRNLMAQVPKIMDVEYVNSQYYDLFIPESSLIYCDPPYNNTDKTYKEKKFIHEDFWEWCREKKKQGHEIFVSEYNAPEDFKCVWQKELSKTHPRQVNNTVEKLFTP